ncbi:efflux RND transporter periplasmic adaptor subunit [Phormidium sp. LEGE 05292]|uniref:efflux RND transporter periplasmic adaptor subunit n=1 Tax=[Phormidium] sp. LEGE 05292 TaxID=767427 RepID=UPI00187EF6F1|nr:efflux RND transporter periplasmic adaptor subunit [Phormidium sp. LEGE 05292]MBE9226757.1 efflux RND transporter periplasmic adaptor subunit [Phormidium sp. LEGE 05292]
MNTENTEQRSSSEQLPNIKVLPVEKKDDRQDYLENYQEEEISTFDTSASKPSKKFLRILGILFMLLLVGGGGWFAYNRFFQPGGATQAGPGGPGGPGKPGGPMAMPVRLGEAQPTTVEENSEYVARLESRQSVRPKPQVSGQITNIFVKPGQRVRAGAPIIQINPAEQAASLQSQLAAVESARSELKLAQADVANAKQNLISKQAQKQSILSNLQFQQGEFRRFAQLQSQGAVTRQALDQRRLDLQKAQADVAQIEAEIRAQEAAIARAEANITKQNRLIQQQAAGATEQRVRLNYYTINAPFVGVIGDIPVKVGDYVSSSSELYTIADNNTLLTQINVPVELATRLRMGMPVKIIDNQGKPVQTGQISFIAPNINPQTQSILVKASFDNSNGSLRTDQFVQAKIIWDTRPGVVVPVTAISRQGGQNFVFVVEKAPDKPENMVARQVPVELGKITGNQQEILKGLQPGQQIVVAGILQLRDGAPIMPESQAPGAGAPGGQGNKPPSN